MTYTLKKTMNPILITCIAGAALTLTACEQAKTETSPAQESSEMSSALKVTYVDARDAYALLQAKPETVVLDLRTPKEIKNGFIEGAVFADFYDTEFAQQLTKLDRDTPYVIHCGSGGRSTKALTTLEELGFTNITHMDGGINDWKSANLPLTKS